MTVGHENHIKSGFWSLWRRHSWSMVLDNIRELSQPESSMVSSKAGTTQKANKFWREEILNVGLGVNNVFSKFRSALKNMCTRVEGKWPKTDAKSGHSTRYLKKVANVECKLFASESHSWPTTSEKSTIIERTGLLTFPPITIRNVRISWTGIQSRFSSSLQSCCKLLFTFMGTCPTWITYEFINKLAQP